MLVNKYKSRAVLLAVIAVISICSGCAGSGSSLADAGTASESVSESGTVSESRTVSESGTVSESEPASESRTVSESGTVSESKPVSESGPEAELQADPDIVTSRADLPFQTGTETAVPGFTGNAYLGQMISNEEVYNFPQTNHIIFEPGARSSWHTHGGMIIMATGGIGYYQEEGKPAQILRPGDVVECAAGVNHWHGAAPDSWFSQMVIYDSHYSGGAGEGSMSGEVTDEWYDNLETEEYTGRVTREDNAFLFQRAAEAVSMSTFNGPVYLSSIIGSDNAAGAPEMHYVVFEPGVINNWHTHEGGQILIATDGIGYHQIEGQPVEVLYPGDVAFCPPGVKHWHGGSADTSFAHIAVNTNPERSDVEWFDILSDEEYAQLPQENID